MSDMRGKVAVVTGGTQGLGLATAGLFAERGAAGIVLCGRGREKGEAAAAGLTEAGTEALFVAADLAEAESAFRVIEAADERFGRVDALVNAAGLTDRGTILDTSVELYDRMFAVNARAPFFLMQAAAKVMRREGVAGTIVNVLSMSAHGGQPFISAYSGSKAALMGLTRNVAYSLMPDRIRCNALNIGWMRTEGEDATQRRFHGAGDDWLEKAEANQPFGRLLDPLEVARAIAFLASDESGMMTGAVIDFDQSVLGSYDSAPHPKARL
ncbi:MAG: SDR family oxidoreductase [Geminicoccaceae bacterium]|nr:SDR family oxidoreductase [Geminicoccaceae bacterium]